MGKSFIVRKGGGRKTGVVNRVGEVDPRATKRRIQQT